MVAEVAGIRERSSVFVIAQCVCYFCCCWLVIVMVMVMLMVVMFIAVVVIAVGVGVQKPPCTRLVVPLGSSHLPRLITVFA